MITLKHGRRQRDAFARPGGQALKEWIEACSNVDYAALTYQGGEAWRARLQLDLASNTDALALVDSFDDTALAALMVIS